MMSPKRLKYGTMLLVVLASGLTLLAWTQTWFTVNLAEANDATLALDIPGAVAAPALTAFALSGLALAGALAIAGVVFRTVLGLLEILLGASVFLAAAFAFADPAGSASSAVTAATGVAGRESIASLVVSSSATGWPVVAMIAAPLMVVAGLAAIVTARRWPQSSRRYQAVRLEPVEPALEDAADHSVDTWDELSRGDDPTV
ncbi:Trp biosynthesis-associated membrane protein [Luethyella okanaganae]|uniref:Trp biosynthesis-associated membrane protein n=1 Tax=Luethyella okanaganae TaxID=69372 RepID=A0ABW1VFN1_9MICO